MFDDSTLEQLWGGSKPDWLEGGATAVAVRPQRIMLETTLGVLFPSLAPPNPYATARSERGQDWASCQVSLRGGRDVVERAGFRDRAPLRATFTGAEGPASASGAASASHTASSFLPDADSRPVDATIRVEWRRPPGPASRALSLLGTREWHLDIDIAEKLANGGTRSRRESVVVRATVRPESATRFDAAARPFVPRHLQALWSTLPLVSFSLHHVPRFPSVPLILPRLSDVGAVAGDDEDAHLWRLRAALEEEEQALAAQVPQYDMHDVRSVLRAEERGVFTVVVEVPGASEKEPKLVVGDTVYVVLSRPAPAGVDAFASRVRVLIGAQVLRAGGTQFALAVPPAATFALGLGSELVAGQEPPVFVSLRFCYDPLPFQLRAAAVHAFAAGPRRAALRGLLACPRLPGAQEGRSNAWAPLQAADLRSLGPHLAAAAVREVVPWLPTSMPLAMPHLAEAGTIEAGSAVEASPGLPRRRAKTGAWRRARQTAAAMALDVEAPAPQDSGPTWRGAADAPHVVWPEDEPRPNPEQQGAAAAVRAHAPAGGGETPLRPPHLVFGPPGTGKTVTVVAAACEALRCGGRCLLTAPKQSAVDVLARKLLRCLPQGTAAIGKGKRPGLLRIVAGPRRPVTSLGHDLQPLAFVEGDLFAPPPPYAVRSADVVCCTCRDAAMLAPLGIPPGHFGFVAVDEAAQATEPETLIPLTLAAHTSFTMLAGDPRQLGPIVRSPAAAARGLARSMLERQMEDPAVDGARVTRLYRNYRSHEAILGFFGRLFYEDTLEAFAPLQTRRRLVDWAREHYDTECPMVLHCVEGRESVLETSTSSSLFNEEEVATVGTAVESLDEAGATLGVIAPFRAQVYAIRRELRARGRGHVNVGTVDDFQGQEADAIIISTTVTRVREGMGADAGSGAQRGSRRAREIREYFDNPKRFNVAISRAKSLLLVVGEPHALSATRWWSQAVEAARLAETVRGDVAPALRELLASGESIRTLVSRVVHSSMHDS